MDTRALMELSLERWNDKDRAGWCALFGEDATLRAPGGDLPATGRRVSVPFINIGENDGERFTDFGVYFDQVELLTQLGVVAAPVG
jgi:ketosteroid isomerase-like protein